MNSLLSILILSVILTLTSSFSLHSSTAHHQQLNVQSRESFSSSLQANDHGHEYDLDSQKNTINRKRALQQITSTLLLWTSGMNMNMNIAHAKVSVKPKEAYQGLIDARAELSNIQTKYLSKKGSELDLDSLRDYIADPSLNINRYEENATALLTSKQLDAESKKEIGTIRRYGPGADVIIMYGGFKAELEEEDDVVNYGNLGKSVKRTMDALDEIITICKSNGF